MENNNITLKLRLIECPEIPENLAGAVLQLKHNGALTQGTVIFFHLFCRTWHRAHSVWLCTLPLL